MACFERSTPHLMDSEAHLGIENGGNRMPCTGIWADPPCKLGYSITGVTERFGEQGAKIMISALCKQSRTIGYKECEKVAASLDKAQREMSIVEKHSHHITEKILNRSCTSCGLVWHDFTGCAAVKCVNCKLSMCAFCMGVFHDAHSHVMVCKYRLSTGKCNKGTPEGTRCHHHCQDVFVHRECDNIDVSLNRKRIVGIAKYFQEYVSDRSVRISIVQRLTPTLKNISIDHNAICLDDEDDDAITLYRRPVRMNPNGGTGFLPDGWVGIGADPNGIIPHRGPVRMNPNAGLALMMTRDGEGMDVFDTRFSESESDLQSDSDVEIIEQPTEHATMMRMMTTMKHR
jgi:hypothetical protein